jgi:hypothetical protein
MNIAPAQANAEGIDKRFSVVGRMIHSIPFRTLFALSR